MGKKKRNQVCKTPEELKALDDLIGARAAEYMQGAVERMVTAISKGYPHLPPEKIRSVVKEVIDRVDLPPEEIVAFVRERLES